MYLQTEKWNASAKLYRLYVDTLNMDFWMKNQHKVIKQFAVKRPEIASHLQYTKRLPCL